MMCPVAGSPVALRITPLGSIPVPYRQEQPVLLNGISVLLGPRVGESISYFVPSLHVELWATDSAGTRVASTLAVSPRAVVLAGGPVPVVPASWRRVSFVGLRFSVPANWPVNRTQVTPGLGAICKTPGVAFASTNVTLSTDVRPILLPPAPTFCLLPSSRRTGPSRFGVTDRADGVTLPFASLPRPPRFDRLPGNLARLLDTGPEAKRARA